MHWSVCKIKNVDAKLLILLPNNQTMIFFPLLKSLNSIESHILWNATCSQVLQYFIFSATCFHRNTEHISELNWKIWRIFCKNSTDLLHWKAFYQDPWVYWCSLHFHFLLFYLCLFDNLCVLETNNFCLINKSSNHHKLYRNPNNTCILEMWLHFAQSLL